MCGIGVVLYDGGVSLFDVSLPEITRDLGGENYGRYRIEPLQPGWGTTLGTSLRRILISSLVGAAVTGLKLREMPDDPSEIEGIEEGLIDLVLNVKQLRFRVTPPEGEEAAEETSQYRATLNATKGEAGVLTGGMLELPEGLEVINPDTVIATATGKKKPFELELLIEKGTGYGSADTRTDLPADMLPVDAMYTPVPKVNYLVEHTRVGQMTDFDRLLLEIWTDGSLPPDDALSQAARVLTGYATAVAGYGRDITDLGIEEVAAPAEDDMARPIEDLNLSMRTTNALKRANLTTLGQVLALNDGDLLHLRNFGQKSLVELREALEGSGYTLQSDGTVPQDAGVEEEEEE